jgi:hypothetical protein
MAAHLERSIPYVTGVSLLVNVLANLALIPHMQAVGAAMAALLSQLVAWLLFTALLARHTDLLRTSGVVLRVVLGALPGVAFLLWQSQMSLLLLVPQFVVLATAGCALTRTLYLKDLSMARQILPSRLDRRKVLLIVAGLFIVALAIVVGWYRWSGIIGRKLTPPRPAAYHGALSTSTVLLNPLQVQFERPGTRVVRLVNVGLAPVVITGLVITGPQAHAYAQRNSCSHGPIDLYQSCSIVVSFRGGAEHLSGATLAISEGSNRQLVPLRSLH